MTKISRLVWGLAAGLVAAAPSPLKAQEAGQTVAVIATPEYDRNCLDSDRGPLDFGDAVMLEDCLITDSAARLLVQLRSARHLTMGPDSKALITVDKADLESGTLRVRTDLPFEVVTLSGRATVESTAFITTCGASITPSNDDCLFVGVYGTTRVESLAFPNQPVFIGRKFFTRVRAGQLPTPPQRISDRRFLQLVDLTTIIGSGLKDDRLAASNPLPPLLPIDGLFGGDRSEGFNPQDSLVTQPEPAREREQGELPQPPPPPPDPPQPPQFPRR